MLKIVRIKNFYKMAQKEFRKFEYSKDRDLSADNLAEAGEKLWNVYNMLVEVVTSHPIRNEKELRKEIQSFGIKTGDFSLAYLYRDVYELHQYFYRGHAETGFEREIFIKVNNQIGKLILQYIK